ncbi:hypothetical protein BGX21_005002 [Mortierella sp. AD011]|nr:hypothetical protein BGX20_004580 [Mortierella sp. AD010]KAF9371788.1 hypothetical protein BGX21_005002 [Mortierella sp. AD011]
MEPNVRTDSLSLPPVAAPEAGEEPVSDRETEEDPVEGDSETEEEEVPANAPKAASGNKPTRVSKAPGKERFSNEKIAIILTWFEHQPNYTKIYGATGQTPIGGHVSTAAKGWNDLAEHLRKKTKGRRNIKGRNMASRFARHKRNYNKVREVIKRTGFGLTDEDRENGIHRLDHKRESMFFGFDRMEALFGHKHNINPMYEFQQSRIQGYGGQITNNAQRDDDNDDGAGGVELVGGGANENTEDTYDDDLTLNDHEHLENEPNVDVENNDELIRQDADTRSTRRSEIETDSVAPSTLKRTAATSSTSSARKAPPRLNTGQQKEKGTFASAYFEAAEKKVDGKMLLILLIILTVRQ